MAMMKNPTGLLEDLEVAQTPKPIVPMATPTQAPKVVEEQYKSHSFYINVKYAKQIEALAKEQRLSKSRILDDILRDRFGE